MPAKAKYTKQIITLVEPELRDQLDAYAKANSITLSDAVRRAVIAGLPNLPTPAGAKPVFQWPDAKLDLLQYPATPGQSGALALFGMNFQTPEFTD